MRHRPSLEAQVYDTIRDNMIKGEYLPGTMLSENELAKELGVSRTPVRATISILEKEGLVESFKGRGVLVKEISFQQFYQIFEVLVSMQLFVMDIAIERKLSFDLETLRLCLDRQRSHWNRMTTSDITIIPCCSRRAFCGRSAMIIWWVSWACTGPSF